MTDLESRRHFPSVPEGAQPQVPIPGYPSTWTFTPSQPLIDRRPTRTDVTGPQDLWRKIPCGDSNLAVPFPGRPAQGQLIQIGGTILDEDGRPVRGAIVELWQANAAGRYLHALDQRAAPLDPNFVGNGRVRTDDEGRYSFFTIKPGAYPVPVKDTWWRPPHVHFSILGPATLSRLVTQMYFQGDPLNDWDRILHSVPDAGARERLIARAVPPADVGDGWLGYRHDIVLRGRNATPGDAVMGARFVPTSQHTIGPFFPTAFFQDGDNDLTRMTAEATPTTRGERIRLRGRVTKAGGEPVVNGVLELWQADADGRFRHPQDPGSHDADPDFLGWGRAWTDADGEFTFTTVLPGAYSEGNVLRAPHADILVMGAGLMRPVSTTIFFPDFTDLNGTDPVLDLVPEDRRHRLIARDEGEADGLRTFRFDIVLRGSRDDETPFFAV